MKPVVDPNPFATAVDAFLVDLELKVHHDALVYAWLIELNTLNVIPRGYDPNLPGLSGKISSGSPLLKITNEFKRISESGIAQETSAIWQEESRCEFLGTFDVVPEKYLLVVLSEKYPQDSIDRDLSQLRKLLKSLESPALALAQILKSLTPREREVCDLVVQGLGNQEIAEELDVSVARVKQALSSVYSRLGVANRAELIKLLI